MLTLSTGLYAKALLTAGDPLFAYPRLGAMVLPPLAYGIFITKTGDTIINKIFSFGLLFLKDIKNGRTNPGTKMEPSPYQSFTTDGMENAKINAIKAVMINPLRTNMVDSLFHFSLSVDVGDWIRHKISLPNVMALMSPKESMVDMMVAPVLVSIFWILLGKLLNGYPFGLEPFYPGILTSVLVYVIKVKN